MTFPLVVALERVPALKARMEDALASERRLRGGRDRDARDRRADRDPQARRGPREPRARGADQFPEGPARDALETVVLASLERKS